MFSVMKLLFKILLFLSSLVALSCESGKNIIGCYTTEYWGGDCGRDNSYYQLEINEDSTVLFSSYIFSSVNMENYFKIHAIARDTFELLPYYDRGILTSHNVPLIILQREIENKDTNEITLTFVEPADTFKWKLLYDDTIIDLWDKRTVRIHEDKAHIKVLANWICGTTYPIHDTLYSRMATLERGYRYTLHIDSSYLFMPFYLDVYNDTIVLLRNGKIKMLSRLHVLKKSDKLINLDKIHWNDVLPYNHRPCRLCRIRRFINMFIHPLP